MAADSSAQSGVIRDGAHGLGRSYQAVVHRVRLVERNLRDPHAGTGWEDQRLRAAAPVARKLQSLDHEHANAVAHHEKLRNDPMSGDARWRSAVTLVAWTGNAASRWLIVVISAEPLQHMHAVGDGAQRLANVAALTSEHRASATAPLS